MLTSGLFAWGIHFFNSDFLYLMKLYYFYSNMHVDFLLNAIFLSVHLLHEEYHIILQAAV